MVLSTLSMQHMMESNDFTIKDEHGNEVSSGPAAAGQTSHDQSAGALQNNYVRPAGQVSTAPFFDIHLRKKC